MQELAREVNGQPAVLQRFARSKLPRAPSGSIFVGAGDSYAAALAAFYASGGRCIALDPGTLASAPEIAEGLEVFFISVSGRTVSNVKAARKVRRLAKRTTTLTAAVESKLAALTDRVVRLPMAYTPRTPGLLSFSLSLVAALQIVRGPAPCDYRRALRNAKNEGLKISRGKGTTYFLGNALAYPVAVYAAAKVYELIGARAHAELLEEFSHLELFSLGKSDVVNAFSCFDPLGMSGRLGKALKGNGFESHVLPSLGSSGIENLFHSVFAVQLSVLDQAMEAGLSKPKFLSVGGRLRTSDSMIY